MPNSNRRSGFGRRSGTVTVIEERVRRNSVRTAKIAACVTFIIVAVLTATVAASWWHPIIALLAGIGIGLATAFVVAVVIIAWPVIRALWWWTAEITILSGLTAGWVELAGHTTRAPACSVNVRLCPNRGRGGGGLRQGWCGRGGPRGRAGSRRL